MKHSIKRLFCVVLILILSIGGSIVAPAAEDTEPEEYISPDFIRGIDVSSVIALERSGVRFRDPYGNPADIFELLAENGVNYVRVRVWNDPYDIEGRGYGGGNCDVQTAAAIGRRAATCGIRLLVDFHYSDFWADPGKQKAPKAWSALSLEEKKTAVYDYTLSSLNTIRDAGGKIGMVQIGNETNLGIAGENSWANMAQIYNAGSAAVRAFSPEVKVAIHYTNPENEYILRLADFLYDYQVDYDVFATSYYPCWHGSLSNLTAVLDYAAAKYGKETMVAETSYPYTLDDSDGHPNTVSQWNNSSGDNMLWEFTPAGQAQEVTAVMKAVNAVKGGKGLGVFYWEGAWITVGDVSGLTGSAYDAQLARNKALWEQYGSGWAASYCAGYDPDDGGVWYGGSAVDNQALFSPDGTALASLRVFRKVMSPRAFRAGDVDGSETVDTIDATYLRRFCAGIETNLSRSQLRKGDADGNGSLEIIDVTVIQRYEAKMNTPFPVGTWKEF